jgi:molecular chaperone DnaK (HSP70)
MIGCCHFKSFDLMNSTEKCDSEYQGAIGIDFGTSWTCVSVWHNNQAQNIGRVPSIVSFYNDEILLGEEAKYCSLQYTQNTVFDIKRLLGRKFDDEDVQSCIKYWPCKIIKGDQTRPNVEVKFKGKKEIFAPEEIIAMILKKMKKMAEGHLQQKVSKVVLTCPANFNFLQRQSLRTAGKIAGLDILRIFNDTDCSRMSRCIKLIYHECSKLSCSATDRDSIDVIGTENVIDIISDFSVGVFKFQLDQTLFIGHHGF